MTTKIAVVSILTRINYCFDFYSYLCLFKYILSQI
uniref:Uncharacterized protein n=1 Tax=Caloglossa intermedia TaxID=100879 RepID=A0A1Z1M5V6_9FLOR|nr:hypothetical protein [Caloglossa intermedia]ARW61477.1 hypothetical protein [Caloglossa intermedia]